MKALKEKRIGFRSLLRRGLVILSLFALIFAVACGGDDGGVTDPGTGDPGTPDPGTPDPGTPEPAKTVTSIAIISNPTGWSYQGTPPELKGLVARVTFSDGSSVVETDVTKFASIPAYCDVPSLARYVDTTGADWTNQTPAERAWRSTGVTDISKIGMWLPNETTDVTDKIGQAASVSIDIVYAGYTSASAKVSLPGVVPLVHDSIFKTIGADTPGRDYTKADALDLAGEITTKLYTDQIPDFSGLVLWGTYAPHKDKLGDTSWKTDVRKPIAVSSEYPKVVGMDLWNANTRNYLTLGVGYNGGDANAPGGYVYTRDFNITGITKAIDITVDAAASTFPIVYDDMVTDFADTPADMTDTYSDKVIAKVRKGDKGEETSDIKLTVSYEDGTQRTITFEDYIANISAYNARQAAKGSGGKRVIPLFGSDGVYKKPPTAAFSRPRKGTINYGEDDEGNTVFDLIFNYVPSIWGDDVTHAGNEVWVDQFRISFPVYTMSEVALTRKANSGASNVTTESETHATDELRRITVANAAKNINKTDKGANLLDALKLKYELTVTYEKPGSENVTRAVALNGEMFARAQVRGVEEAIQPPAPAIDPASDTGIEAPYNLDKPVNGDVTPTPTFCLPTNQYYYRTNDLRVAKAIYQDFPLPIWYRGTTVTDADGNGVVIDVVSSAP